MRARQEDLPSQEELLVDFARRLQRHRAGRVALWLHLSRLERENRDPNDVRLAANLLRPLAQEFSGEVFVLDSSDIVVCLKNPPLQKIDAVLFQVRYSFGHDPLMRRADDEGETTYLTRYQIHDSYAGFLKRCQKELISAGKTKEPAEPSTASSLEEAIKASSEPLPDCPDGLGPRLILSRDEPSAEPETVAASPSQAALAYASAVQVGDGHVPLVRLSARETITQWNADGSSAPIGSRLCVPERAIESFGALNLALARGQISAKAAVGEVERTVAPHLAHVLTVENPEIGLLSLRLETTMTPEFADLVGQVEEHPEASIWIALDAQDVGSDLETANYIHGYLQQKGIPVGVSGLTPGIAQGIVRFLAGLSFAELAPAASGALPEKYVSGLVRLLDSDNILIGKSASAQARKEAHDFGARRFVGPVN